MTGASQCKQRDGASSAAETGAARPGYTDLMPAATAAQMKLSLPKVDDLEVQTILNNPDTMWYDEHSFPPAYQDSYDDPKGVVGNDVDPDNVVSFNSLFKQRGRFHFPFGVAAGLENTQGVRVVQFWLPPRHEGKVLPVKYWLHEEGRRLRRWRWIFPVGTVFGEVLFIVKGKYWYPFELRLRTRFADAWAAKAFRPFTTALELAAAIKAAKGPLIEGASQTKLKTLVKHLESSDTLQPHTVAATNFKKSFPTLKGAMDYLPPFGDDELVAQLLRRTPFKSAEGKVWKRSAKRKLETYAAATKAAFSIVPAGYDGGMYAVNDIACRRCHQDAGRPFGHYYLQPLGYGELWGEDEIFTWSLFDLSGLDRYQNDSTPTTDNDNRYIRKSFWNAGLVAQRHAKTDDPAFYQVLKRAWPTSNYIGFNPEQHP